MKNFLKPVNNALVPISRYYLAHENVILPAAQVGLSLAEAAVIFKNADKIKSIVTDAKTFIAQSHSKDEVNNIYKETLKTLTPLVLPIILLTTAQIVVAVKSKKAMDLKDKKVKELSDAMAVANNAIVTYQAFQKEAEKKLGAKKTDEIKEGIAKEIIKENPEKKENSMINTTPATANEVYHYYDTFGGRYFFGLRFPPHQLGRKLVLCQLSLLRKSGISLMKMAVHMQLSMIFIDSLMTIWFSVNVVTCSDGVMHRR